MEGGGGQIVFHAVAALTGPGVQIVRVVGQHCVDVVHVHQGNALLLSVDEDSAVDVVPLTVGVDDELHHGLLVFSGHVLRFESA